MVAALWQGGGGAEGRRAAFIGADRLGAELGGAHQPPAQHHHQPPTTNILINQSKWARDDTFPLTWALGL